MRSWRDRVAPRVAASPIPPPPPQRGLFPRLLNLAPPYRAIPLTLPSGAPAPGPSAFTT